ncbi:MAG: hypothetical protein QXR81_08240, partial [Candidatus Nezhaarchaeales archaeon]
MQDEENLKRVLMSTAKVSGKILFLVINHIRMPSLKAHAITRVVNANAMARLGFKTVMIAPRRYGVPLRLDRLYEPLFFKIILLPFVDLQYLLKLFRVRVEAVSTHRLKAFLNNLSMASFMVSLLFFLLPMLIVERGKKLAFLVSEGIILSLFIIIKGFLKRRLKIVYELHDLPDRTSYIISRAFFIALLKRVDVLVALSRSVTSAFTKLLHEKITVLPHGYDSTLYPKLSINRLRRILNLPLSKKIILYSGSLPAECKSELLIEFVDLLVNKFGLKDVLLLILGKPVQELIRLRRIASAKRLNGYVL